MFCMHVYVSVQLPGKQSSSNGVKSSLLQILLKERNPDRTAEKLLAMTLDTHTEVSICSFLQITDNTNFVISFFKLLFKAQEFQLLKLERQEN